MEAGRLVTWRLVDRWTVADASKWPGQGFALAGLLRPEPGDFLVVRVADAAGRNRHVSFRRVAPLADARAVSAVELNVCPEWAFPVCVRLLHGGANARSTI